jgi:hypothetical protein
MPQTCNTMLNKYIVEVPSVEVCASGKGVTAHGT